MRRKPDGLSKVRNGSSCVVQFCELQSAQQPMTCSPAREPANHSLECRNRPWIIARVSQIHRGLNENLARELMELFTLGVGSYSETDVKECARALTGLTVAEGRFLVRAADHEVVLDERAPLAAIRSRICGQ